MPLEQRCDYCACLYRYTARSYQTTRATREEERAIIAELQAAGGMDDYRERMAPFGHREVWHISYSCPGCQSIGTHYGTEFTQQEAEDLAEAQNRAASTPEAVEAAAHWEEEVRRRTERDARRFADLFRERLPEWERYFKFVSPEENPDPDLERGLIIRVPSPNQNVERPLQVRVSCRWVEPGWGDWHTDFWGDGTGLDLHYMRGALQIVEWITSEESCIGARYRNGELLASCLVRTSEPPPARFTQNEPDDPLYADRILTYSWRGTHDRIYFPPG